MAGKDDLFRRPKIVRVGQMFLGPLDGVRNDGADPMRWNARPDADLPRFRVDEYRELAGAKELPLMRENEFVRLRGRHRFRSLLTAPVETVICVAKFL